jgi:hypothetical protein
MAGYVRAHLEVHGDRSYDVVPIMCPGADEHSAGNERCFTQHADGWTRCCVYWVSGCMNDNVTARVHPSTVKDQRLADGMRQSRMGVICQRQRGNRPAGC